MLADLFSLRTQLRRHGGEPLRDAYQQILHGCDIRLFAADAHLRAAGAARGLLALVAEHLVFHIFYLLFLSWCCAGLLSFCLYFIRINAESMLLQQRGEVFGWIFLF